MQDPRNPNLLQEALKNYETLVQKTPLKRLCEATFCPSTCECYEPILFKIEALTSSVTPQFFTFVLNALAKLEGTFGYILQISHEKCYFYIGLKTTKNSDTATELLKNGLSSTFPSSKFRELSPKESALVLEGLFNPLCYDTLSSAIVIPNNVSPDHTPINEKFLNLMGMEPLTAFFLASPVRQTEILCLINELRALYTTLSSFSQTTFHDSHSSAKNGSFTVSKAATNNKSSSCTETDGDTQARSTLCYKQLTVGTPLSLTDTQLVNLTTYMYSAHGTVHTDSHSIAKGDTLGLSTSKTDSQVTGHTATDHDSISFKEENKEVLDYLAKLKTLIDRLTLASHEAMFCFGAYFLSKSAATCTRGAFTYSGLATTIDANSQPSIVNTWPSTDCSFSKLVKELSCFNHLSFENSCKETCLSSSTLVSATELVNSFYFPYPLAGES